MAEVNSYCGIDEGNPNTLDVVFESLEEMFACACRNDKFNEKFQILPLELKVNLI